MSNIYKYKKLQNSWCQYSYFYKEEYSEPVTMSYPQWIQYVSSGKNVLQGSGGVIPSGTVNLPFLGSAVYRGKVQKYGMYF